jgi:hypothetical protein
MLHGTTRRQDCFQRGKELWPQHADPRPLRGLATPYEPTRRHEKKAASLMRAKRLVAGSDGLSPAGVDAATLLDSDVRSVTVVLQVMFGL